MALLKIIKLSNKTWKHNSDVDGDFILTKFYAKQEDNNFLLVESYGSKRRKYLINEIEVYDIGGTAETFANFSTLFLRLEALSYPAFYEDGVFIFNPNDYISSDSGNALVLGTDNNFFVPSSGGGGSTDWSDLTNFASLTDATTPLAGTEEIAIVQGGETKKVAISEVGGGASLNQETIFASRTALPEDKGKLIKIRGNATYTIDQSTLPTGWNVIVRSFTGATCTFVASAGTIFDAPNGLILNPLKMCSIIKDSDDNKILINGETSLT